MRDSVCICGTALRPNGKVWSCPQENNPAFAPKGAANLMDTRKGHVAPHADCRPTVAAPVKAGDPIGRYPSLKEYFALFFHFDQHHRLKHMAEVNLAGVKKATRDYHQMRRRLEKNSGVPA